MNVCVTAPSRHMAAQQEPPPRPQRVCLSLFCYLLLSVIYPALILRHVLCSQLSLRAKFWYDVGVYTCRSDPPPSHRSFTATARSGAAATVSSLYTPSPATAVTSGTAATSASGVCNSSSRRSGSNTCTASPCCLHLRPNWRSVCHTVLARVTSC